MKDNATTGFLGFESIDDFTSSLFGIKHWLTNVMVGLVGGMTSFIVDYMWDTPSAVYTLWILMGADWLTGIIKGMINKRFVSYKLFRMPLYYVATSFVISISWWMAKGNILFTPLPGIVMAGFYSVYFVSLLENLGEIGFLPKPMVTMLKTRFGLKKVVDKYFEKEEKDGRAD
jgi:phage-related holin